MDERLWFKDELRPAEAQVAEVAAELKALDESELYQLAGLEGLGELSRVERDDRIDAAIHDVHGFVSAHYPVAIRPEQAPLVAGTPYLVRLGLEFDIPPAVYDAKWRYRRVWCRAQVSATADACLPRVVEVFPDRFFEKEPMTIKLELKPSITWGPIEVGLGSAATDVQVGAVTPATLGFLSKDQREPYWEMTEQKREIRGRYHFWLLLDVPTGCDPQEIELRAYGEGDLQTSLILPIGPKHRFWSERPVVRLADILVGG